MASRGKPSRKCYLQWLGHLGGGSWRFLKSPNSGFTYKEYEKNVPVLRKPSADTWPWRTCIEKQNTECFTGQTCIQWQCFRLASSFAWQRGKQRGPKSLVKDWCNGHDDEKTTSLWKLRGVKDAARVVNVSIFERVCWNGVHTNWLSATFVRPNWARSGNQISDAINRSCTLMRHYFLRANGQFFSGTQYWIV